MQNKSKALNMAKKYNVTVKSPKKYKIFLKKSFKGNPNYKNIA